ncbi:MAG: redoxin domain-containing protein [Armatimonadetes bacterium]|nr:redoxin domain-containing protein [Armatimonadota bacterium]
MTKKSRILPLLLLASAGSLAMGQVAGKDFGHSAHGKAFDTGMRTKPWKMDGIGTAPFRITTKVPEVQEWFNQGNALLHSFWYEEAERTFRWCLKLDPDCAMAYWGLTATGLNWSNMGARYGKEYDRYRAFLKEAAARKDKATPIERAFIEAWEAAFAEGNKDSGGTLSKRLLDITKAHPNDIEAKAYAGLYSIGLLSASENDKVLQQVIAVAPSHPGAHHYRIHNWDFPDPYKGVDSCRQYGSFAPGIGHAMHMPGHIFSKVGMWHEAAIAMDGATRVELKYMNARMALPFEEWNFAHNRTYLSYIQEQLGMADAAIQGARDLIAAPLDPLYNNFESYDTGVEALVRALVKFERWGDILRTGSIPWRNQSPYGQQRAFIEGLAYAGTGKVDLATLRLAILEGKKGSGELSEAEIAQAKTPEGRILAANILSAMGKPADGAKVLKEEADKEVKAYADSPYGLGDPPGDPIMVPRMLAELYLKAKDFAAAIPYFEATLKHLPYDGFSLSGLAVCHAALRETEKARQYAGKLRHVWSGADRDLRWLKDVTALGLRESPVADPASPERIYKPSALNRLGPGNWEPYEAPKLAVTDANGRSVRLTDYRGKNVLLIFYLSDECVHCMEQLRKVNGSSAAFEKENTAILAVSSATPKQIRESLKLGEIGFRLLSDKDHENARRFASYDDFENIELHSTILIDSEGKVRWKRTGGDPFDKVDWLLGEVRRVNAELASPRR